MSEALIEMIYHYINDYMDKWDIEESIDYLSYYKISMSKKVNSTSNWHILCVSVGIIFVKTSQAGDTGQCSKEIQSNKSSP